MEFLGYIAIMVIGLVLGSMGSGGSMLAVPVLVYLFSLDVEVASAYSLFIVGITSVTGAVLKQKERLVSARAIGMFGIPSVTGAFIARKWIIALIPDVVGPVGDYELKKHHVLLWLLSFLMILSSVMILLGRHQTSSKDAGKVKLLWVMPSGFFVGMVTGLAGAGGGFLVLPALILFAGLSFEVAVGTTLFIIAANSLLGFCGDAFNLAIQWYLLWPLTSFAVAGLLLGHRLTASVPKSAAWQRALAWVLLTVGIFIMLKEILFY